MQKDKQIFIIRSNGPKNLAVNAILNINYEQDPLYEVIIQEHKKNRSLSQNALYWIWNTEIGKRTGETKDEVHERHKKDFLIRIFEKDPDKRPEYCEMLATLRELYKKGFKKESEFLFKEVVRLTSTTDCDIKEFTEYLNDIEKDSIDKGIILSHPEDHYYNALGMKG